MTWLLYCAGAATVVQRHHCAQICVLQALTVAGLLKMATKCDELLCITGQQIVQRLWLEDLPGRRLPRTETRPGRQLTHSRLEASRDQPWSHRYHHPRSQRRPSQRTTMEPKFERAAYARILFSNRDHTRTYTSPWTVPVKHSQRSAFSSRYYQDESVTREVQWVWVHPLPRWRERKYFWA